MIGSIRFSDATKRDSWPSSGGRAATRDGNPCPSAHTVPQTHGRTRAHTCACTDVRTHEPHTLTSTCPQVHALPGAPTHLPALTRTHAGPPLAHTHSLWALHTRVPGTPAARTAPPPPDPRPPTSCLRRLLLELPSPESQPCACGFGQLQKVPGPPSCCPPGPSGGPHKLMSPVNPRAFVCRLLSTPGSSGRPGEASGTPPFQGLACSWQGAPSHTLLLPPGILAPTPCDVGLPSLQRGQ